MKLHNIFEMQFISGFSCNFAKSPRKINKIHTCDAEIIDIYPEGDEYLAITTDTISEELQAGLYRDPYTIGWMAVIVNLSDLAAVGAQPLGIVTSVSLESQEPEYIRKIGQGISDACMQAGTFILGGDTNFSSQASITGTAIGSVKKNELMTRCGMKPGDTLFISGKAGIGNGLGICTFIPEARGVIQEQDYRPSPRVEYAKIIRKYASACMDTSDGLFSTIAHLVDLNQVGIDLTVTCEKFIEEKSLELCQSLCISPLVLAAGIHGEFELVFSIPDSKKSDFLESAGKISWTPVEIGKCTESGVCYMYKNNRISIDIFKITNLFFETKVNLKQYIQELITIVGQITR